MTQKPYQQTIQELMKQVREMVLPFYGAVGKIEHKSDTGYNVVTELDKKVEIFLAEKLQAEYKDINFFGEEFGGNKEAERFWLADPIDGTAHFVRGMPFCTSQIALIEEGKVVFSAIYDFVNDEIYMAKRGEGATKNGEPISVSNRPFSHAYLAYEIKLNTEKGLQTFIELGKKATLFTTVNAGYEYAMVASGKIEGRICSDPFGFDYDFAPGSLLVEEAGGIVRNIKSDTYDFKNYDFIASNPMVYKELKEINIV